ncbi:phosphopantothenate--cysteine ligase 1-like [Cicer arietinum]|uniref:Phosphopantothenate--cysteine ligase 1-like n=1 Tax=Cicer arietinum TaxID=3827 RepID=A0A1S3DVV8_CICAR|nr:phosphopantothenate--cysteine ligase 1-like [Cicer arietinum]
MLQMIAMSMRCIGPWAMFYLAPAVSDYYVPWKDMVEHKIQSGSHLLDVKLVQVPKMLSVLRKDWAPLAFCISFKLETDSSILLNQTNAALEKYKMHAVVANELLTRKEQVVVVTSSEKITVLRDNGESANDVENPLIKLLSERHVSYIEDSSRYTIPYQRSRVVILHRASSLLTTFRDLHQIKMNFTKIRRSYPNRKEMLWRDVVA